VSGSFASEAVVECVVAVCDVGQCLSAVTLEFCKSSINGLTGPTIGLIVILGSLVYTCFIRRKVALFGAKFPIHSGVISKMDRFCDTRHENCSTCFAGGDC